MLNILELDYIHVNINMKFQDSIIVSQNPSEDHSEFIIYNRSWSDSESTPCTTGMVVVVVVLVPVPVLVAVPGTYGSTSQLHFQKEKIFCFSFVFIA
jgi:hypothetical protein